MADAADTVQWESREGVLRVTLPATLDAPRVAAVWDALAGAARKAGKVEIEAGALKTSEGSGLALIREFGAPPRGKVTGLSPEMTRLLGPLEDLSRDAGEAAPEPEENAVAQFGRAAVDFVGDLREILAFLGQSAVTFAACLRRPALVRWGDFWLTVERAGLAALPIVGTISFLTGMILAFQAASALQQFGVEIFVVNLVSLAMLREMGVIMTSVVLAGRSGSAFAAEIGTMKINEEIDALETMGLEPVRFLVVPRLLAGIVVMPVLTIFSGAVGIAGGFFVMRLEGFPFSALWLQLLGAVKVNDLLVGFIKSFFFGFLVAGIGCLRGLQTRSGASAVGISTTRAVVSGIFLIVAADAVFAAVFYVLNF